MGGGINPLAGLRDLIAERDNLEQRIAAALHRHRRSIWQAGRGPHRGERYCVACTTSVDDYTVYVPWPCPTVRDLTGQPQATTSSTNSQCTGLSALWCPVHGDCTCPDKTLMDDHHCPLHAPTSAHAEGIT